MRMTPEHRRRYEKLREIIDEEEREPAWVYVLTAIAWWAMVIFFIIL